MGPARREQRAHCVRVSIEFQTNCLSKGFYFGHKRWKIKQLIYCKSCNSPWIANQNEIEQPGAKNPIQLWVLPAETPSSVVGLCTDFAFLLLWSASWCGLRDGPLLANPLFSWLSLQTVWQMSWSTQDWHSAVPRRGISEGSFCWGLRQVGVVTFPTLVTAGAVNKYMWKHFVYTNERTFYYFITAFIILEGGVRWRKEPKSGSWLHFIWGSLLSKCHF